MSANASIASIASNTSFDCVGGGFSFFIYTSYCLTSFLLVLPLCVFVVYQWWVIRSPSSTYSNCFTSNLVFMEMAGRLGSVISWFFYYKQVEQEEQVEHVGGILGYSLIFFAWYGEMLFHVLTCVERHLAVVHPVTYLGLRGYRGIRIRTASAGCVWLLCFVGVGIIPMESIILFINFGVIVASMAAVSFCSISVLRVLIRRGPGDGGQTKGKIDQTKMRAFLTILAILGALVAKFMGSIVFSVMALTGNNNCAMLASLWFSVPSRLVLPLLFLNRAAARRRVGKINK